MSEKKGQLSNNNGVKSARIIFVSIFFAFLLLIYIFNLYSLQVVDVFLYESEADRVSQRTRVIPTQRGLIYDRDFSITLAGNRNTFTLTINPELVGLDGKLDLVLNLSRVLGLSANEIENYLPNPFRGVSPIEFITDVAFENIIKIAEQPELFPGIQWKVQLLRNYPLGPLFSHIVGYVGSITAEEKNYLFNRGYKTGDIILGKTGIEKQYDEYLRGTPGISIRRVDVQGRSLEDLDTGEVQPELGKHIVLTIDTEMQELAARALGKRNGSVVILRPHNGEILAMVSYPSFDSNLFITDPNSEKITDLSLDPSSPFLNRGIQSVGPPASTFKVLMSLAALDSGVIDPSYSVYCNGFLQVGNRRFNDHILTGHGRLDLSGALAESCNIYFYTLGKDFLYSQGIAEYMYKLGFGQLTEIDLSGEQRGNLPTAEWKEQVLSTPWLQGDTVNLSIGQGFVTATPLQLANMLAQILNGGTVYQPHLLKEIRDPLSLEVIEEFQPQALRQEEFDSEALEFVKESMRGVITNGTANGVITTDAIQVAGKTGTGETGIESSKNHSWFISYGPYNAERVEDQIVVVVWVDASNEWEWWAPKAANIIFHGIFSDLNYEETIADLRAWYLYEPEISPYEDDPQEILITGLQ